MKRIIIFLYLAAVFVLNMGCFGDESDEINYTTVGLGTTVSGAITENDVLTYDDGYVYYDAYRIRLGSQTRNYIIEFYPDGQPGAFWVEYGNENAIGEFSTTQPVERITRNSGDLYLVISVDVENVSGEREYSFIVSPAE